jgi:hypothetical protein
VNLPAEPQLQLDLFERAEALPDPVDRVCPHYDGAECFWHKSCSRDGCWRRECEQSGRPLFGTRAEA